MSLSETGVREALKNVLDPELGKDIITLNMVRSLKVEGNDVSFTLMLTTPACPLKDRFQKDVEAALKNAFPKIGQINIHFDAEVRSSRPPHPDGKRIPGVKNVIAVGSGKGGVGKSTVAVNLALALQKEGAKTGLLDADIYGPSIPIMCGVKEGERPQVIEGGRITPLVRFGLPLMSMGFLMEAGEAVIWRGPMLGKVLQQFLEQVQWGELDYLVVDLPPGTGDVQLSLSQLIPISGAVVVTTPQDVALVDVARSAKMFRTVQVPLLGVVENMSGFECPHCHKTSAIFGGGGVIEKKPYKNLDLPLLGSIPLELETRISGDEGIPILVRDPESVQSRRFREIA
ncbi:MAG: Mrp/NBP35 family ATP-binding protein, partial [bacterium]|nr:Mrp/NBP35 family ATP-binding protein [bacterium]